MPVGLTSTALFKQLLDTSPDAMLVTRSDGIVAFANSRAASLFGYSHDEFEGSRIDMLVPVRLREGHALHRATYHDSPHVRPMGGNLNIYALRKDGSEFPAEISLSYLDTDDGLLISTAIRDVTDRKRTEHALDERLRFELLISAIAATLSEVAPDELDTGINDGLRQIGHFFDMDRCYFNQISVDGSEFRVTHLWHAEDLRDEEAIKLKRFEFYREFPWFATKMLARESIFVSRLDELPPEATAERQYCLGAGIVSFATVPLVVEESVLGNLSIIKSAPMTWSEDIPPRVELLCDIFASTLLRHRKEAELRNAHQEVERLSERLQAENLRLAEEIVERKETETTLRASHEKIKTLATMLMSSQEEESKRIARELHDDTTQRLAALGIDTEQAIRKLDTSPARARRELRDVQEKLSLITSDIHKLSRRLHPSMLDDVGLINAVRSECHGFSKRYDTQVDFVTRGEPDAIPKDIALTLYRIVQEALNNTAKHARAERGRVELAAVNGSASVVVEDDGAGFDAGRRHRGLGLSSLEERVKLYGGELEVRSSPGAGTRITAHIPFGGVSE